jgi:hypothetical protein
MDGGALLSSFQEWKRKQKIRARIHIYCALSPMRNAINVLKAIERMRKKRVLRET